MIVDEQSAVRDGRRTERGSSDRFPAWVFRLQDERSDAGEEAGCGAKQGDADADAGTADHVIPKLHVLPPIKATLRDLNLATFDRFLLIFLGHERSSRLLFHPRPRHTHRLGIIR